MQAVHHSVQAMLENPIAPTAICSGWVYGRPPPHRHLRRARVLAKFRTSEGILLA